MDRRKFIKNAVAVGASTTLGAITGCESDNTAFNNLQGHYRPGEPLPWINWARNQFCKAQKRLTPSSIDELVNHLQSAKGVVRAVGAGHSFSPLVPTNDCLVSTDLLSGLVSHSPSSNKATVLAGTRLSQLGSLLTTIDQALPNMPDVDYPALGGALATATHGTGKSFGCLSTHVVELKLATTNGELLTCSVENQPDIFRAARTSLGALGILAEVTLQNQSAFKLTEVTRTERLDDVLDDLNRRIDAHRNF